MIARKKSKPGPTKFSKVYELQIGNFIIVKGDIIKIQDEHGTKFQFDCVTTNIENGKTWVDCFEMHKNQVGNYRSFAIERVKRIPARRGKRVKKNVN